MPAACAACTSRSASPTYTQEIGATFASCAAVQQRSRVRFAFGQGVAADDAGERRVNASSSSRGSVSHAGLLVTIPATKPRASSEFRTSWHPGEQVRVRAEGASINLQKALQESGSLSGVRQRKTGLHHPGPAVADGGAHSLVVPAQASHARGVARSARPPCRARYRVRCRPNRTALLLLPHLRSPAFQAKSFLKCAR